MHNTLSRLQEVFQNVFDDDTLTLNPNMHAGDIEAWDSVMHVSLMMEVESAFKVRLSTSEIAYLKTVGDLVELIEKKQKK